MSLPQVIENTMYFVALINPVSKIFFLSSKKPPYSNRELYNVSIKANIVALVILVILTCLGDFLMVNIFHVEIYSLSVAGGVILFIIGLNAVRKETFLDGDTDDNKRPSDISIVPLAAPMIAGPGTMTAAITLASIYGMAVTLICITIAIAINLGLMLLSYPINHTLARFNATGPIIRIMGLIVTAVAMQMIFSGCATWITQVI